MDDDEVSPDCGLDEVMPGGMEVKNNFTNVTCYVPGNERDAKTDDICHTVPLPKEDCDES